MKVSRWSTQSFGNKTSMQQTYSHVTIANAAPKHCVGRQKIYQYIISQWKLFYKRKMYTTKWYWLFNKHAALQKISVTQTYQLIRILQHCQYEKLYNTVCKYFTCSQNHKIENNNHRRNLNVTTNEVQIGVIWRNAIVALWCRKLAVIVRDEQECLFESHSRTQSHTTRKERSTQCQHWMENHSHAQHCLKLGNFPSVWAQLATVYVGSLLIFQPKRVSVITYRYLFQKYRQ